MKYLLHTWELRSLGPSIAIAKELARRGHEVAFVSEPSAASWLSRERLTYISLVIGRQVLVLVFGLILTSDPPVRLHTGCGPRI